MRSRAIVARNRAAFRRCTEAWADLCIPRVESRQYVGGGLLSDYDRVVLLLDGEKHEVRRVNQVGSYNRVHAHQEVESAIWQLCLRRGRQLAHAHRRFP